MTEESCALHHLVGQGVGNSGLDRKKDPGTLALAAHEAPDGPLLLALAFALALVLALALALAAARASASAEEASKMLYLPIIEKSSISRASAASAPGHATCTVCHMVLTNDKVTTRSRAGMATSSSLLSAVCGTLEMHSRLLGDLGQTGCPRICPCTRMVC